MGEGVDSPGATVDGGATGGTGGRFGPPVLATGVRRSSGETTKRSLNSRGSTDSKWDTIDVDFMMRRIYLALNLLSPHSE